MATIPSAVSLENIADGASILASPHRNNYSAAQTFINDLRTILVGGSSGQFLQSGGATAISWADVLTTYRKLTPKPVNTTVAATDLLNGEITVAAGAMSTNRILKLLAWGDWKQNSGGAAAPPRFQLTLGGTPMLDTGTSGTATDAATRFGWKLRAEIMNLTASSQIVSLDLDLAFNITGSPGNAFTTGTGTYTALSNGTQSMAVAQGMHSGLTVDTSSARALALNVVNGSASANYETKLFGAFVEIL